MMRKTPTILLLMLWLCGGANNVSAQAKPSPAAKPLRACALITKAEVEQAIGTTVDRGIPHDSTKADVCTFANQLGNKVNIYLSRSPNPRDLSTLEEETKKILPNAKIRPFPGLGDKALLLDDANGGTMLSVYRGGDSLVVSVYGIRDGAKADAAVEAIARKAFSRL